MGHLLIFEGANLKSVWWFEIGEKPFIFLSFYLMINELKFVLSYLSTFVFEFVDSKMKFKIKSTLAIFCIVNFTEIVVSIEFFSINYS